MSGHREEDLMDQITAWNDNPNRTKDEVLAMMDRALGLAGA